MTRSMSLLAYAASLLTFFTIIVSATSTQRSSVKVVVAGASSGVGSFVFRKLLERQGFYPIGLVSDQRGYNTLKRLGRSSIQRDQIQVCDFAGRDSLKGVFTDAKKAVILTTSTPSTSLSYKFSNIFRWLVGQQRPPRPNEVYFRRGQRPYDVFLQQRLLIDEAVRAGVEQIVLLSAMGGASVTEAKDLKAMKEGHLLYWKRETEKYLMRRCAYTILHVGRLTSGSGGEYKILQDVDDQLLRSPYSSISHEDCAEVIIQALLFREAQRRSIDIAVGSERGKTDWIDFWTNNANCHY